jgi:Mg-chelatase subunit ChlD
MNSTTHYVLIMDASGSMSTARMETLHAINEQIENCRIVSLDLEGQFIRVSLSLFNTDVRKVYTDQDPVKTKLLRVNDYQPNGYTALLDAIGMSIKDTEAIIKPEDDVVMLILTDGQENASQFFTFRQIAQQIERLKATEKWTFSFMGADIDAWDLASRLNIEHTEVISFEKESLNVEMDNVKAHFSMYMEDKINGKMKPSFFRKK